MNDNETQLYELRRHAYALSDRIAVAEAEIRAAQLKHDIASTCAEKGMKGEAELRAAQNKHDTAFRAHRAVQQAIAFHEKSFPESVEAVAMERLA